MPDVGYCEIQVGGHRAGSKRYVALVDEADTEMARAHRWSMSNGYVARQVCVEGKLLSVYLHRELLGLTPGDGVQADHINGNELDNRRENLRACTNAQNLQNRHNRPYRGAYWNSRDNHWVAQVMLDRRPHNLGRYATREAAAEAASAFRRQHMPYSRDAREAV